jgi:hypothetical protein
MALQPVSITLVRWPNRDAANLLDQFVNGGRYAGRRAPRGIDPEYVTYWLRENVKPDCGPAVMMRTVDLLRFYECRAVLEHTSRFLSRNESDEASFRRAMYVLQAIGELGTPEQATFAARYFNEYLLPLPFSLDYFALTLETAETLSISIDASNIGRRLKNAIAGSEGIQARKYDDYARNNLPNAILAIDAKRRLQLTAPMLRLQELLFIYLGESNVSSMSMEIWAGRMLRAHAMDDGQDAVLAAFAHIFDNTAISKMAKPRRDFLMFRAGQAIQYLQGKFTFAQEDLFAAISDGPENFLCDDLILK